MKPKQIEHIDIPALEKLSDEYISQSKYILNAALMEVLRDKNSYDVQAVKQITFSILESEDRELETIKHSLIDGLFLDAADELTYLAERSHEKAGKLHLQAAVLYLPIISTKALSAFEKAEAEGTDLTDYALQLSNLYRRMGDPEKSQKYEKIARENGNDVDIAGRAVDQNGDVTNYASDMKILPLTLRRDTNAKFVSNLKLDK
ncbi:MAG: hypothetical protein HKN36_06095 [Hellea sp.]|nr:hypothetical protein [Hellea sp.]